MDTETDLLIIGAGPFGLAMAAYAKHLGLDYRWVGKPMEFWNRPVQPQTRSCEGAASGVAYREQGHDDACRDPEDDGSVPRDTLPARLWLRPASNDREAVSVIIDKRRQYSTGCRQDARRG
jgi:hypothetical protein